MARSLNTKTLSGAAKHYAAELLREDRPHPTIEGRFLGGPSYVMRNFFNFTFMDEFDFMFETIRGQLGPDTLRDFDKAAKDRFEPRSKEVLAQMLLEKLAVDVDGNHVKGAIGTTKSNARIVGYQLDRHGFVHNAYWPIYAGEHAERIAGNQDIDPLPEGVVGMPVGALNTRIANVVAIGMCNFAVDELDTGAQAGVIEGRSGAQPADPDTAVTGTLLFSLPLSATAFGAASDAAPGAIATANAITADSSADATATLGYCRASTTTTNPTPVTDLIDGEAGTSGADFNFNTLEIVSGATVDMTSWTVTQPET